MNLQLHHVVADITGVTGMQIMWAIVAGTQDPAALAVYRDVRCKASVDTVREALTGNYRPEHVFALRQALELYDSYQEKIAACDTEIAATLASLEPDDGCRWRRSQRRGTRCAKPMNPTFRSAKHYFR
jgi:hypothetical protein